jgi:hypothetical protein
MAPYPYTQLIAYALPHYDIAMLRYWVALPPLGVSITQARSYFNHWHFALDLVYNMLFKKPFFPSIYMFCG